MDSNVMVKKGEVEQKTRVLSTNEVESLEQSLGSHRRALAATEQGYIPGDQGAGPVSVPEMRLNKQKLSEQAEQIRHTLDTCKPEPIAAEDKDKFKKRADWLKEQFVEYLETRAEIHVMKRDRAEWHSAMEKARARPKLEKYITEWQSIMRRLEPGNPEADNLHRLRRDR